jgi:hypothetical protein
MYPLFLVFLVQQQQIIRIFDLIEYYYNIIIIIIYNIQSIYICTRTYERKKIYLMRIGSPFIV